MPRGEILEQKTDAYIDGIWYTIAREAMTYNSQGKRITSENLAGQRFGVTGWRRMLLGQRMSSACVALNCMTEIPGLGTLRQKVLNRNRRVHVR